MFISTYGAVLPFVKYSKMQGNVKIFTFKSKHVKKMIQIRNFELILYTMSGSTRFYEKIYKIYPLK